MAERTCRVLSAHGVTTERRLFRGLDQSDDGNPVGGEVVALFCCQPLFRPTDADLAAREL